MKTAVVILNWNGEKYLKRFLAPLLHSLEGYDAGVIVADNNSTDGSLAYIESCFEGRVGVICLDRNYGFAEGYNRALAQVEAKYFLLLNSDVLVEKDWLFALEEWMDLHDDCAACCPKLLSYDDRERFEYAGAAGGLIDCFGYAFCRGRILSWTEKDEGQYDMPADVFWASGACMMVRSKAWKDLGGFDGDYFAHFEEIDFCWRARLEGWRICCVPRSRVFHIGGGTLPNESPRKLFLNYRNNLLTYHKNLARTLALEIFCEVALSVEMATDLPLEAKERKDLIVQSARHALSLRRLRVFERKLMDGISAIIYLFQGKKSAFKAVWKAHQDYRKLIRKYPEESLEILSGYLEKALDKGVPDTFLEINRDKESGHRIRVKGMLDDWVVPIALRYKDKAHERIINHIAL
ncbi:MAG: glycosyltransferase family 2 protein [Bacteroidales bacterium]|nr:glycosyltransferase family 2 protein [Bacteroidales bacterium]